MYRKPLRVENVVDGSALHQQDRADEESLLEADVAGTFVESAKRRGLMRPSIARATLVITAGVASCSALLPLRFSNAHGVASIRQAESWPTRQQPAAWPAPRRQASMQLRPLWRSDTLVGFPDLPYPSELSFAQQGLAIYDYADKRVHVIDATDGRARFSVGRRGGGPGEFGDRNVRFFGLAAQLRMIEYGDARVAELVGRELRPVRIFTGRRFYTACAWGSERILVQSLGHPTHDDFVTTVGAEARLADSLTPPWPQHRDLSFLVRQAQLRQLDDSTCAHLPVYQREFALLSANAQPRLGRHVEALPPARSIESATSKMRRSTIAKGARGGALDARRWRHALLVLFEGATPQRRRILDVYDWDSLEYRGSLLLPLEASRIAVHGDTLVALGEFEDAPQLRAFHLREGR
jgi:hypothetical protein